MKWRRGGEKSVEGGEGVEVGCGDCNIVTPLPLLVYRKDELRLKSNADLHKLWFVLLKERNMLLTMEEAYRDKWIAMPNPERIDKVGKQLP